MGESLTDAVGATSGTERIGRVVERCGESEAQVVVLEATFQTAASAVGTADLVPGSGMMRGSSGSGWCGRWPT